MPLERTRYRKINLDTNTLVMLVGFLVIICVIFYLDSKKGQKEKETIIGGLEEKNSLYKKEAMIAAKEAVQKDIEKFQDEAKERRQEFSKIEAKLSHKEETLEEKERAILTKEAELQQKMDNVLDKEDYLAEIIQKQTQELERISGMSSEDAKHLLLEQLKNDLQQEANALIRENENHIKEVSNEKAKEILTTVMQRCAIDQVVESTVSSVSLPSDEMKGRIIGREGRNIRTLETLTGVDLIIDDTPEAVVLSCFDPVRREIAKLSL